MAKNKSSETEATEVATLNRQTVASQRVQEMSNHVDAVLSLLDPCDVDFAPSMGEVPSLLVELKSKLTLALLEVRYVRQTTHRHNHE